MGPAFLNKLTKNCLCDLARAGTLALKSFDTQQNVDQLQAKVDQLKASILADEASVALRTSSGSRRRSSPEGDEDVRLDAHAA